MRHILETLTLSCKTMMILESITLPIFVGITLVAMLALSGWMLAKKKEGRWAVALFTLFIVAPMSGMMGCIMGNLFGIISVPRYTVSRCEEVPLTPLKDKYSPATSFEVSSGWGEGHWTRPQPEEPNPQGSPHPKQ